MLYTKLVLMALFWSGVFPAINIVLSSMGLVISVFLRFWFAAVILLILLRLREPRLPRPSPRETVLVIGLGILGISVYNTLFTAGLSLVEASRAAVIVPTGLLPAASNRGCHLAITAVSVGSGVRAV